MKNLQVLVCLPLFILNSCNSIYHPLEGKQQDGYYERTFAENEYIVGFRGQWGSSRERTRSLAMLRAAEIALENGYTHFKILKIEELISHPRRMSLIGLGDSPPRPGGDIKSEMPTDTSENIQAGSRNTPECLLIITFINVKKSNDDTIKDAQRIRDQIRKKYRLTN